MSGHYQKVHFLLSVANIKQLPPDLGVEIAIVGRSNAGKSSVLNTLTHNKQLARVSRTPGRTQFINMFAFDAKHRIADLPGYGFAKAPRSSKQSWQKLIKAYFEVRESLQGVLLVMDIRHPFKAFDQQLLKFCSNYHLPVHILLNKSDKLTQSACIKTMKEMAALTQQHNSVTFQCFSALKGKGVKELQALLDSWYGY